MGDPTTAQLWTLHRQSNRLLSQSKRVGRHADVDIGRGRRKTLIGIDLAFCNVSDHHMSGQSIHAGELPKNGNHGLTGIEPLAPEEITQIGTEFVLFEGQDRVERERHRIALTQLLPAIHC